MKPGWGRFIAPLLAILLIAALAAWLLCRSRQGAVESFTGYVVADNLYLSSPVAGAVEHLWVARGQRVAAGAPLFRIDPTSLGARADEARAEVGEALAGVDADRATLAKARAAYLGAETDVARNATDLAHYRGAERGMVGAVGRQQLDQARFAVENATHQRDAARQAMHSAQAEVASAQAQVAHARAGLTDAERQVAQLSPPAPVAGVVEDTFFQPGEWAPANAPVISLVPDGQVKVRFYVPQGLIARYPPGTRVAVRCDGCRAGMTASVDRVATRPEYTPPVIYSLKERDKLVFMVEAVPDRPQLLRPGQPIDVSPLALRPRP